ncbi:thermonuclease family protein [Aurantivibrio plasticivorans]
MFGNAVFASPTTWGMDCPELPIHERTQVSSVHDGDTLRLTDGRRVRLIAINAPELARDGNAEQPLARASREAVEAFLAETQFVHLSFESRRADRYGRVLAHVTLPSGRNLESHLISQGLAFPLAVPPDLAFSDCLMAQAKQAQKAGLGLWNDPYWQAVAAHQLNDLEPAFRRVCGVVQKVDQSGDLFIELEGDLVLRVAHRDMRYFEHSEFDIERLRSAVGMHITVSGWLIDRSDNEMVKARGYKPWLMQVRTPYALDWAACPKIESN